MPKVTESGSEPGTSPTCDVLYYDGQCPICSREVRSLSAKSDDRLAFIDIHSTDLSHIERERYSRELHLRTADGRWITGLEANVQAWQHTAVGPLAAVLLWRFIRPMAEFGYRQWLRVYHWHRRRRQSGVSEVTK